jgi:hypothetical protein
MQTSCLVATFIVLFHILGPRSDTLRQCPRLRSDNGSDNGLFFIGKGKDIRILLEVDLMTLMNRHELGLCGPSKL